MRHQNKVKKLQRTSAHRRSLLANLVCSLIEHKQIRTTLAKAKAVRPVAEKMVTLAKRGDLHARRQAIAYLRHKTIVSELFQVVGPLSKERKGGYTRIVKLGQRLSDSAPMAFIEWVDRPAEETPAPKAEEAAEAPAAETPAAEATEAPKKKRASKKAAQPASDEPAE